MKRILAALLLVVTGFVLADTTSNLVSGIAWTGPTTGTLPANRMPGSVLLYDSATGTVNWSYSTATAAKTVAINNALSGSGVQVGGYNYTYDLRNMNGDDRQGSIDTMTVVTKMTSNTGATLLTNTNTHNTKFDWTTFTGTQSLNTSAALSGLGNLSISFTSRDTGFWAGYFGPEVRNVGLSLNYTVDPCTTNPAYSTTCANYNTVSTSGNLLSGTTGTQAYAINTALASAGAGATIHGFDYGYTYNVAGRDCAVWNLFGICISGWNYSDAGVTTTLTNSAGVTGYTESNTHNGGDNGVSGTYSKALRLNSSAPMSTLGTFSMVPWTSGTAGITNMYSNAVYTADPCVANPLSSTTCAGYAQAYHDQQCSATALYAVDCAGYAAAYAIQQCTANPLYNSSCPGYAQAYYTSQCSTNTLYDSGCPGYTTAYHNQQCSINPLYMSDCTGYQTAYKAQQCSANPLYATDCPGYTAAYNKKTATENAIAQSTPTVSTTTTIATTTVTVVPDPVTTATTAPSTTSPTSVSPAAVNSVVAPQPTVATSPATQTATTAASTVPASTPAAQAEKAADEKKTGTAVASVEKKAGGDKQAASKAAGAAAKENLEKAAKAKTIEDQVAAQGVVVGLMGYVPGFSAYQNAMVPDVLGAAVQRQYMKPPVDNRNVQRRMTGASDARWQEMVDSQYKIGN